MLELYQLFFGFDHHRVERVYFFLFWEQFVFDDFDEDVDDATVVDFVQVAVV